MQILWEKFNQSHFSKFVFVGVLNTLVGYGTFAALIFLDIQYIGASVVSHIVGVTNSYLWNKYFTFRADTSRKDYKEIMRFIGVYTIHYVIGLGGLVLLVEKMEVHPLAGQAIVLAVTALFSFFAQKRWVFKKIQS